MRPLTWRQRDTKVREDYPPMVMTYYQAALVVLRSAGRPLTTNEIARAAVAQGLIRPSGRTPEASMSSVLYAKAKEDGELHKLSKKGPGRAARGSVRWTLR